MVEVPVIKPAKYFGSVRVACEVCLKEVPRTEAQHDEGGDYVVPERKPRIFVKRLRVAGGAA